eukprot:11980493-Karenia_brevis.AAC.1
MVMMMMVMMMINFCTRMFRLQRQLPHTVPLKFSVMDNYPLIAAGRWEQRVLPLGGTLDTKWCKQYKAQHGFDAVVRDPRNDQQKAACQGYPNARVLSISGPLDASDEEPHA